MRHDAEKHAEQVLLDALDSMMELTINQDGSLITHIESVKIAKIYHDALKHEAVRNLMESRE